MTRYVFEDFAPGMTVMLGPVAVSKEEIIAFATEFDPQPFHIDEIAARDSFVGTLIASGWHTCALNMQMFAQGLLLNSSGMGAPGIETLRWLLPVKPGDTLRSRLTVTETRESKSRPHTGLVQTQFEVTNQRDEVVMTQSNWVIFGRRDASSSAPRRVPLRDKARVRQQDAPVPDAISSNPFLEDLIVGTTEELGTFTFSADDIVRFASQFDPQPFHIDAEAAKNSLFGGLCASGWHTASAWMKLLAAQRHRVRTEFSHAASARPAWAPRRVSPTSNG